MSDVSAKDAVGYAMDGNVSAFKDAVDSILMDKVQAAVELKKLDVASNFMSAEYEEDSIEGDTDVD